QFLHEISFVVCYYARDREIEVERMRAVLGKQNHPFVRFKGESQPCFQHDTEIAPRQVTPEKMAREHLPDYLIGYADRAGRYIVNSSQRGEPAVASGRKERVGPLMDCGKHLADSPFRISSAIAERHRHKRLIVPCCELDCECLIALELVD